MQKQKGWDSRGERGSTWSWQKERWARTGIGIPLYKLPACAHSLLSVSLSSPSYLRKIFQSDLIPALLLVHLLPFIQNPSLNNPQTIHSLFFSNTHFIHQHPLRVSHNPLSPQSLTLKNLPRLFLPFVSLSCLFHLPFHTNPSPTTHIAGES